MRRLTRALALAGVSAMIASSSSAAAAVPSATSRPPTGSVAWLSTGDSYSSGEGIPGTGVGEDTCARSLSAFGPQAATLLGAQRGWNVTPLAFSACTGHLVGQFYNGQDPGYGSLWNWAQQQTAVGQKFDVITMSFGGNDIGFKDVVEGCIGLPDHWASALAGRARCEVGEAELARRVDQLLRGRSSVAGAANFGPNNSTLGLSDFYAEVANEHLTDRGALFIVGYPRLFAQSSSWGAWRGYRCNMVVDADADMLGRVAARFDQKLREAVAAAQSKTSRKLLYLSQLELFDAAPQHSLCSGNTEWLNGVSVGFWDGSGRIAHSFHPNELGHQAAAEQIAQRLDDAMAEPEPPAATEPPTTSPPPITAPGGHFDVGDTFDSYCVVAWPTAPTRTTQYIEMTMSCTGVPQQYTFVDVAYPDPNLPINPSTGRVHVHGQIVDMATSEFGFRELVVQADRIDL